ncbi:hypothetical protein M3M35_07200 [Fructilactobacillus myrtifloralis]|uniref:Uncharacterized protein n=1 Tax=Fructilactobacillus myrtifloralis TaxID=2940301 RepID=A0ABY5BS53_9LACO|nr:hypothetical protein [Fructilactobacillus myrtifloralis]USS85068.1 hypothetical protein M3M35_07200 [Fructilactobacillus myrtifloralis]
MAVALRKMYYIEFVNTQGETLGYFQIDNDSYCWISDNPSMFNDPDVLERLYREEWGKRNAKPNFHVNLMEATVMDSGMIKKLPNVTF